MAEEQENFYRHCTVIVDVLKDLFLQLIEFYLDIQGITFEDFIRKYQHEIYHLCVNMYPCCNCPVSTNKGYRDSKVLYDQQMFVLLDKSGAKLPCHNPRSRSSPKCCSPVKSNISVQSLDVSLARVLLINFLVFPASQERKAIDDLITIRNNSYGHAKKGHMTNDEYRSSIDEITKCLLIIARICKKETEIKHKLSFVYEKPFNIDIYIQLQTKLLQQIERDDKIEKAIEKLKIAIEDLKLPKDLQLSLAETFSRPLDNKKVYEGHDVQFECEVTRSDFEGKWLKKGIEVRNSQNMSIEKDGRILRLDIYGTSLQDRGDYSCIVNDIESKAFLDVKAYFTRTLRNKSCSEGDTVNLVCEVTETDTSAQWYKDGANIETNRYIIKQMGKTHQLTITCASPYDNGCFKVDINSRVREASLKVNACFIKDIKSISCTEGQNVFFSCDVHPENAALRWFKGKKEIKSSDKYVVKSHNRKHELEIKDVNICDSTEITVRVKNCTRTCTLDVRKCFNHHLQSQKVIEGYSVQFGCELSCPNVFGEWYKDDLKIESSNKFVITKSGTQNRLVVKNTSLDDKGEYSFRVQNISTKATLVVEDYFKIQPSDTTCKEGDTVHLTCEAIENSLPAQWCKDGLDIDTNGGKFSKHQNKNACQLTIRSVNQMDSGCYSVDISGRIRNADVTVTDYFIEPLKYFECREGETAEFRCKSIEPPSTVEWSKNGKLIDHNRCIKKQVKHTNKLRIQYAEPGDSGCYRISVNARTSEAFLKVKDYFTMSFNDITCKEGETARFKCETIENGMVVKWYKDNKEIQSDKYIVEQKGQVYQLTINNGDPMDTGYYSIRVNGRTRTAFLMIEDFFTMNPGNINCMEGQTAIFKWATVEIGKEVKWYKDKEEIGPGKYIIEQNGHVYQLTINNVDAKDCGCYSINVNGRSRTSVLRIRGSFPSCSSNYFQGDSGPWKTDEISIGHESHIKNGIEFSYSISISKRLVQAKAIFSLYLFGLYEELYTRASALVRFRQTDEAVSGFKVIKVTRNKGENTVEVYENRLPHKIMDLIQMFDEEEGPLSSQLATQSKLEHKTKETMVSGEAVTFQRSQQNQSEKTNTCTKQIDRTNCLTENPQNICKTKIFNSVKQMSKCKESEGVDIISPGQTGSSFSNIRTTSPNNRKRIWIPTTRTKMKNAKVRNDSSYKPPKLNIFTTRDENITNIVDDLIGEDIVRHAVYGFFNNEDKMHFQRPMVTWPSMHPPFHYKVRYLKEKSRDHKAEHTTSSAPEHSEKDSEGMAEPQNKYSH